MRLFSFQYNVPRVVGRHKAYVVAQDMDDAFSKAQETVASLAWSYNHPILNVQICLIEQVTSDVYITDAAIGELLPKESEGQQCH